MFNALNRFISRLDSDGANQRAAENTFGFQVLRNLNADILLEPWFDFIIGINGHMIELPDPNLFAQEVRNCAGREVTLAVWSAKGQQTRTLHILVPTNQASLGLSLQYASLSVTSTIWHILDVPSNSPADLAGLLPYSDYILGTPSGLLHGESGLGEVVDDHIGRPLVLYVYNNEYDVTREVTITPSREWGGEGALGCVLGYGALHRLPAPLSAPVTEPGTTMFEGESARFSNEEQKYSFAPQPGAAPEIRDGPLLGSGEFLVPSQLAAPPPPRPLGTPIATRPRKAGRGQEKVAALKGARMMDDYFAEGEKKSMELDYVPTTRTKSPLPPPPKASQGPPRAKSPGGEGSGNGSDAVSALEMSSDA